MLKLLFRAYVMVVRVIFGVVVLAGLWMVLAGYPPDGNDEFMVILLGGFMILLGLVAIQDPTRVNWGGEPDNDEESF